MQATPMLNTKVQTKYTKQAESSSIECVGQSKDVSPAALRHRSTKPVAESITRDSGVYHAFGDTLLARTSSAWRGE